MIPSARFRPVPGAGHLGGTGIFASGHEGLTIGFAEYTPARGLVVDMRKIEPRPSA